jgi:hypothetical protein
MATHAASKRASDVWTRNQHDRTDADGHDGPVSETILDECLSHLILDTVQVMDVAVNEVSMRGVKIGRDGGIRTRDPQFMADRPAASAPSNSFENRVLSVHQRPPIPASSAP